MPLLRTFDTYPKTWGGNSNIYILDKKNTTSLAIYKSIKKKKTACISQKSITVLYLQDRRAELLDEDCLATPDPTNLLSYIG